MAIKCLRKAMDEEQRAAFLMEISLLQALRSKYIVLFLGACWKVHSGPISTV